MKTSVIVLNRDRPAEIKRCVKAMGQQTHRSFELVIVTNAPDLLGDVGAAKVVRFDDENVSAARNHGIAASAGDIIAFCDDDAVPEPTWLDRLVVPFSDETIGGVGGLVRGRNGISVQWGPQTFDRYGNDWPLEGDPPEGRCLKTVGTNCAFRRDALSEVQGFDESFRYFLDETDLNSRLAEAGWGLSYVSDAEVHHSYASNACRTSERVPRNLYEIGASKAYFCQRHGDAQKIGAEIDGFRRAQMYRLIKAMHLGLIEPRDVTAVMETLDAGLTAGKVRTSNLVQGGFPKTQAFQVFPSAQPGTPAQLRYGLLRRGAGRKEAERLSSNGDVVTLFEHSPTALMARVWYDDAGYWHHRGGIFGRINRDDPYLTLRSATTWVEAEMRRVHSQRNR